MNIKTNGLIIFDNSNTSFASRTKGFAQVSVNDEFIIKGIRICEGANGPYAIMPSQNVGGEYRNLVFPITAETREQILGSVIQTYNNMAASGISKLPPQEITPAKHSDANIFVALERHNGKVKAVGRAVINRSIVISGIKVIDYTDKDGNEVKFAAMPSILTANGNYRETIYLLSTDFAEKLNDAIMEAYEKLQSTEFRGISYDMLRKTGEVIKITSLGKAFVQKLINELEEAGIAYSAMFDSIAHLFIKKEDEELFNAVRQKLTRTLVGA